MKKRVVLTIMTILLTISVINADVRENKIIDLKKQIIQLQNEGELGFKDFTMCSNIVSYASYVPLKNNNVKNGTEVYFYYEPKNMYTSFKDNLYEVWFTQDMIVLTDKNEELLNKKDALSFHYTTKSPILDLYVTNTLTISGLPPGKYIFKAVLKDLLRKKEAVQTYIFQVVK